jgi:hypothetical protein
LSRPGSVPAVSPDDRDAALPVGGVTQGRIFGEIVVKVTTCLEQARVCADMAERLCLSSFSHPVLQDCAEFHEK